MDDERPGARRGLQLSVAGLLVAVAGLIVLALATRGDAPVLRESGAGAAPVSDAEARAQLREHRAQGSAVIDASLPARLAELRGVPVVVNQWASWCPPCRAEFPYFAELADRYGDRVAFLGLNARDDRGAAQSFLAEHPVPYPSVFDRRAEQARAIGAGASWPTTVFYDASGEQTLIRRGGYAGADELEADIRRHALGLADGG